MTPWSTNSIQMGISQFNGKQNAEGNHMLVLFTIKYCNILNAVLLCTVNQNNYYVAH